MLFLYFVEVLLAAMLIHFVDYGIKSIRIEDRWAIHLIKVHRQLMVKVLQI